MKTHRLRRASETFFSLALFITALWLCVFTLGLAARIAWAILHFGWQTATQLLTH